MRLENVELRIGDQSFKGKMRLPRCARNDILMDSWLRRNDNQNPRNKLREEKNPSRERQG
jgi:hypothetical protein